MEIRRGIWQVNADDALMRELDGWRARARILQFTFKPHLAEAYGADLICPGSYRFNTIIRLIRKQGILSQAHIPHHFFHEPGIRKKAAESKIPGQRSYIVNSSQRYGQYLLLKILVSQKGLQKKESIHTAVVNLSCGQVLNFALPTHLLQPGGVPREKQRRRKCSLKRAFANAARHLAEKLSQGDHSWARQARRKLIQEKESLASFFEGKTASEDFAAKTRELQQRLAPVMQMDVLRGAILFIPLFYYRLVIVEPSGGEKAQSLCFDPISNLREFD